jgi:hypothetical protein
VARRATLTRGCAEARLADLAQEPFAQCSPWNLAVAMVWQVAGAKNADAARRFARGPIPADRSHRRAHPLQFDLGSETRDTSYRSSFYWAPEINE